MITTVSNRSGCGASTSQPRWADKVGAPTSAIDFGDVLVWPRDDSAYPQYVFLPLQPLVSEQPNSKPHVGLMDPGGRAFFYATLQLSLHPERLEQIRDRLATDEDPVPRLSPAFVDVTSAEVVMTDDAGCETVLHTRKPAPQPPYTALLQFTASDVAKPVIEAALQGNFGRVTLRYRITRHATLQPYHFTIEIDLGRLMAAYMPINDPLPPI